MQLEFMRCRVHRESNAEVMTAVANTVLPCQNWTQQGTMLYLAEGHDRASCSRKKARIVCVQLLGTCQQLCEPVEAAVWLDSTGLACLLL